MLYELPNQCRSTAIKVTPKNWKTVASSVNKKWRVYYRFYEHAADSSELIVLKSGLNYIKDWRERKEVAETLIKAEWERLTVYGFNPLTKSFAPPVDYEIAPWLPINKALEVTRLKLSVSKDVLKDMKSALKGIAAATSKLCMDKMEISKVSLRHLNMIMAKCAEINPRWSARRHNMYRSYLIMLYKKMRSFETVPANFPLEIERKQEIKRIKPVLSSSERKIVSDHLKTNHYRFWLFVNIFFHSGGRIPELLQLKRSMVDLETQKYRCIVKKRKQWTEIERTIKDVSLPFWKEILSECNDDQYLFGVGFIPASEPMADDTVGRTWNRLVKKELKIKKDFYSLKHLHTTEVVDILGSTKEIAEHNAHTSEAMVVNIYDAKLRKENTILLRR
jgi:integrase